ncbi:hypothetical protein HMPREF1989_01886 [Porphyromonas gingivalis F0566]|nr:hypothetical protein HMPREF1989_01886 [Porphyromonas gingivalis F0566]
MHHTGIKTSPNGSTARSPNDFNCTIQELKPNNLFSIMGVY